MGSDIFYSLVSELGESGSCRLRITCEGVLSRGDLGSRGGYFFFRFGFFGGFGGDFGGWLGFLGGYFVIHRLFLIRGGSTRLPNWAAGLSSERHRKRERERQR